MARSISCLRGRVFLALAFCLAVGLALNPAYAQDDNPDPPDQTVRLIFIHHSTGENWLADEHGGLGQALAENNYFVSDTNYGWGPDAIGDRTDIVNWPEWFRGPESERYLAALYAESEQHAAYTRLENDPGGENEVVMFKSCFPNSYLEGSPDDPPAAGDGLTVSNAKYIYNDLLNYFATRPDKLFVVITAPPVQDPALAENARAFNTWLMQDWLRENDYALNNVAVFDFYNVLTHPDNHHRFVDGQVQYVADAGKNTLYYPSAPDDDHPNAEGSRKATQEFVPLLNVFYHRWKAGAPASPPSPASTVAPQPPGAAPAQGMVVDDFEADLPPGSSAGWQPYWDERTQTRAACAAQTDHAYAGKGALHLDMNVDKNSWSTCAFFYDEPVDWSAAQGISLYVHAAQPELGFDVIVYRSGAGDDESYYHSFVTSAEMVSGWAYLEIPWAELVRAEWESDSGATLDPAQVTGMAFGFGAGEEAPYVGQIWADEIHLVGLAGESAEPPSLATEAPLSAPLTEAPPAAPVVTQPPAAPPTSPPPAAPQATPEQGDGGGGLPCPGAFGAAALAALYWGGRKAFSRAPYV
jgi:hypothetical protein